MNTKLNNNQKPNIMHGADSNNKIDSSESNKKLFSVQENVEKIISTVDQLFPIDQIYYSDDEKKRSLSRVKNQIVYTWFLNKKGLRLEFDRTWIESYIYSTPFLGMQNIFLYDELYKKLNQDASFYEAALQLPGITPQIVSQFNQIKENFTSFISVFENAGTLSDNDIRKKVVENWNNWLLSSKITSIPTEALKVFCDKALTWQNNFYEQDIKSGKVLERVFGDDQDYFYHTFYKTYVNLQKAFRKQFSLQIKKMDNHTEWIFDTMLPSIFKKWRWIDMMLETLKPSVREKARNYCKEINKC